ALVEHGVPGEHFDRLVVQALVRLGPAERNTPRLEALRNRGRFSRFLQALVDVDHACGTGCSAVILRTMAQRGIVPGYSNEDLRDRARQGLVGAAVGAGGPVRGYKKRTLHLGALQAPRGARS